MDVKDVERKKIELENNVLNLIREFEAETGCLVDDQGHILYTAPNNFEPQGSVSIPVSIR